MNSRYIFKSPKVTAEGRAYRQNDCTVITLANALNITYDLSLLIYQHVVPLHDNKFVISRKKFPKSTFMKSQHVKSLLKLFANEKEYAQTSMLRYAGSTPFQNMGTLNSPVITSKLVRELNGTHIALERNHMKVIHEGYLVDTSDSMRSPVYSTFRIYKSKYMPFLEKVCKELNVNLADHIEKKSLNHYIKNYDAKKVHEELIEHLYQNDNVDQDLKDLGIPLSAKDVVMKIDNKEYTFVTVRRANRKYPIIITDGKTRAKISVDMFLSETMYARGN